MLVDRTYFSPANSNAHLTVGLRVGVKQTSICTFGQGAGADISCHAAAGRVSRVIAGVDLDLVAGEVAQVGDDRWLLGEDSDHRLSALKGFLALLVWDVCALWWTGGRGLDKQCSVGDPHHSTSLSSVSVERAGLDLF